MRFKFAWSAVLVALLLVVSAFTSARGAVSPRQSAQRPAAVTESAKVILPETSVNAPGFYRHSNQSYRGSVIAWDGTDPLHHLNVARLQGF